MNRIAAAMVFLGFAAPGCQGKQLAHSGEDPLYPLRGLHAAVPCVGCHGEGTPDKLPTACIDCHDDDRPDPNHHIGQDCYGCHVEDGWDIVETTITIPPTPTGDTGTTGGTPTPGFDHSTLPESQLCWDCHEDDRKDLAHYADKAEPLLSWDCQGCHTATAWDWEPIVHPVRIPHGARSASDCGPTDSSGWSAGCVGCHPSGTDTFVCMTCHSGVHGGSYAESLCLGCHVYAEPTVCN